MSADADRSPLASSVGLTKPRCPMCGAALDQQARQCPACGEELQPTTNALTVPLYSLTAIGLCTFLWSFAAGMLLVWLNCRRLEYHSAANRTLVWGVVMLLSLIVATEILPNDITISLMIAFVATLLVTNYAKSELRDEFKLQREQGGPYRSIWLAHALGLLVMILLVSVLLGIGVLIEMARGELES